MSCPLGHSLTVPNTVLEQIPKAFNYCHLQHLYLYYLTNTANKSKEGCYSQPQSALDPTDVVATLAGRTLMTSGAGSADCL